MHLLLTLLFLAGPGDPLDHAPEILERVAPLVAKACGAEFAAPPRVLLLSEREAGAAFAEDLRPQVERLYPQASPGQVATLLRLGASSSVLSCVARYSPSRKAVVLVRAGFKEQFTRLGLAPGEAEALLTHALAHECVHALDDQRFDIAKLFGAAADREALRARAMVVEGRALVFGGQVSEKLRLPDRIVSLMPGGTDPAGTREILIHLLYSHGRSFISRLLERGGRELADRAMAEPPARTHFVIHPDLWPECRTDPRPAKLLGRAFPDAEVQVLSELELRGRYAELDGLGEEAKLFRAFRGGVQTLVGETNAAVLAFADEESAQAFLERSRREVPASRVGTLVVRAAGSKAAEVEARLREILENPD